MSIVYEERASDSPFVDTVMRGVTVGDGTTVRPAEMHWHMVFTKFQGILYPILVGPWKAAGELTYTEGAEILWVRFKLGVFMPHLPTRDFPETETILPTAAGDSFWLRSSAWQLPDFENVETFVERLAKEETLVRDPLVEAVLEGLPPGLPSRTLRHRFLRATGVSHNQVRQFERAQQAVVMLGQGHAITETAYELGYFDQPHMTRALKQVTGLTPGQIARGDIPG